MGFIDKGGVSESWEVNSSRDGGLCPAEEQEHSLCDSHQQGTETPEHLHSYNIFNVEVFQGSGVGVLPFVTLDDDLLHDPVEQQPVLDSVATSFICREGRGQTDVSKGEVVALLGRRAGLPSLQQALGVFLASPGTHKASGDSGAGWT